MRQFTIGQRWISEMELKLGLGIVKQIDGRTVKIHFPASDCCRLYAASSAPLKRVEFLTGDTIESRQGLSFQIQSISIENDIIVYHGKNIDLSETDLKDTISFTTPNDRLKNGLIDHNDDFEIRFRSLQLQHRIRKSPVRGIIGGRIDLIPHQLCVVNEISSRYIPRVLLSDETGLGKTIEACLTLHRLILCERIDRVLIMTPHSLVHQWFVELLRRFNIIVRIFDKELKESMKNSDANDNPFFEHQICLCSIDFLSFDNEWKKFAINAEWDMIIIDEAHHLLEDSPQYHLAKNLSKKSKGLMLLTATPEQFGHQSHYLRMHLLDSARYYSLEHFEKEEKHHLKISEIINKLKKNKNLNKSEKSALNEISSETATQLQKLSANISENREHVDKIIEDLIDRYGTGRVIFRNTREVATGFPKRLAFLIPLECGNVDIKNHTKEFKVDHGMCANKLNFNFNNDPRIIWLVSFLKEQKDNKILLICHSKEKVTAIKNSINKYINIDIALFYEDLTLIQRDRNAAWFAEENGAQLLISSEIGSEGRNFQFSSNLVLFDLPMDPELLEQRIGRLDRIGQQDTIKIHIPYLIGSEQEILAMWYHNGLNAFKKNVPGVYQIYQALKTQIDEIIINRNFNKLDNFIKQTQNLSIEVIQKIKKGRDRLFELNSYRPEIARRLINEIRAIDEERELEEYMLKIFDLFHIQEDYISEKTYSLNLTLLSNTEFPLPALRNDVLKITFDRATALTNEDIEFITWDHPMVSGILELIPGSEKGNCAAAVWHDAKNQEILLEAIFILECIAPKKLYIDRFLPPTPVRVLVNHTLRDCEKKYPVDLLATHLKNCDDISILNNQDLQQEFLPKMLEECGNLAETSAEEIKNNGLNRVISVMQKEIDRLKNLQKVNKNIKDEEILSHEEELELLQQTIQSSRLRLDSIRFIYKGEIEMD